MPNYLYSLEPDEIDPNERVRFSCKEAWVFKFTLRPTLKPITSDRRNEVVLDFPIDSQPPFVIVKRFPGYFNKGYTENDIPLEQHFERLMTFIHENVAKIYRVHRWRPSVGENSFHESVLFDASDYAMDVIMEYCDGMNLADYARSTSRILNLQADETRQILIYSICEQLLQGIGYLHGQGLIHRDIKGQNVVIAFPAESNWIFEQVPLLLLKIIDMDYSRFLTDPCEYLWTETGTTSDFCPPEGRFRLTDELTPITLAFDIWSYGCVFFQLLGEGEFKRSCLEPGPPTVPAHLPKLNGLGNIIISRCLKQNPQERLDAVNLLIELRKEKERFANTI